MATLECKSAQRGVPSKWVEVKGITDAQVAEAYKELEGLLAVERQPSDAVAKAFLAVAFDCPKTNPSDLWQHVIYRRLLDLGWSDNRWKRVSGFALERVFVSLYNPRLAAHGIIFRTLDKDEANRFLSRLGTDIPATKVDLFIDACVDADIAPMGEHIIFGSAHVKSSIAERIQDDVPASRVFMEAGLVSVLLTMDAKSYPPPHGECINFGELGGRTADVQKARIKRDYVEKAGQFDGLFSFNLRTPPSTTETPSGKRIYTLGFHEKQPDELVRYLAERWSSYPKDKVR